MHAITRFVMTALATTFVVGATALPAAASAPVTWESGEPPSMLYVLLVFVGLPIALFAVIAVFVLFMARNNYEPPAPR